MAVNRAVLAQNELIDSLDQADREALMGIAVGEKYAAGTELFRENQEAFSVKVLLSGRIGLLMDIGTGQRLMIHTVDQGEMFGWSGLVPPYQYTSTAVAMEDSEVASFPSESLRRLFEANPRLGYEVMQRIAVLIKQRLKDNHLQLIGLFSR